MGKSWDREDMTLHGLLLLVFLLFGAVAQAQQVCETVYLPDLAPLEGVQTTEIRDSFPVPPTATLPDLYYPFNLVTRKELNGSGTVEVTQTVGDPAKAHRMWTNVTSVSLVSWMSGSYPNTKVLGEDYAQDAAGIFRRMEDHMILLGYTTLPNSAPPGVIPTWAYRTDHRVASANYNAAMSKPVQLGEGWNVGVFAPNGMLSLRLQIEARICYQTTPR